MLRGKCLLAGTVCSLLFGLLLLALGIAMPLVLQNAIDSGLDDLWMQPSSYTSWGSTPGKVGIKIVREYTLFNLTNPKEVILGARPRVVELGSFPFQEYSVFTDWTYLDDNLTPIGQKVPSTQRTGNFVAYNSQLQLIPLARNSTFSIPLSTPIVSINAVSFIKAFFIGFYALAHSPFPFYSVQFAHDSLIALRYDLYPLVIAKVIWEAYLSNPEFLQQFLTDLGFSQEEIYTLQTDSTYGFMTFSSLKQWVVAILEYRETGSLDDGAYDILQNHFQMTNLEVLVSDQGFLWEAIDAVQADMQTRYGTSDPLSLALYQWATLGVSVNLPFGLGSVSPPIYQGFNRSIDYAVEIATVQQVIGTKADFTEIAGSLMNPQYTYPMNNTSSLLNLDNMTPLFEDYSSGNYEDIISQFNLTSDEQIYPILAYLTQSGNYSITLPNQPSQFDGYSLALSRLVSRSLVNGTVNLYYDAYYAVMARALFCHYALEGTVCSEVMTQAQVSNVDLVCGSGIGWDITQADTWVNLQLWLEASLKSANSVAFKKLLAPGVINKDDLTAVLYTSPQAISVSAKEILTEFSERYSCSKDVCTYDELFYLQLGAAGVTNNLPEYFSQCGVSNTTTMQDWLPSRYRTPIEWRHIIGFSMPSFLASQYLTYNAFLNPTALKLFFNFYFSANITGMINQFAFPNTEFIYLFYRYFEQVIPGFGMIMTSTVGDIIYGSINPFLEFLSDMSIYQGGLPSTDPFYKVATANNDSSVLPKHIMYSGKNDSSLTRQYYAYYGHHNMDMYWPGYSSHSPSALAWQYSDIWNGINWIGGSDGGQFGTRLKDDSHPYVFISSLLRSFELTRVGTDHYHGLDLGHYIMSPWQLKNSVQEPKNAAYWQLPTVITGFMNISSQFGNVPIMISLPHCYLCNQSGMNMIEYYAYNEDPELYMTERITPHQTHDQPYASIHQLTGAGVNVVLTFQVNLGVYKDYFFPDFYEEFPGAALYIPFYVLKRSYNFTEHQVKENFGPLLLALELKKVFLLVGTIIGSVLTVTGLLLAYIYYRKIKKPTAPVLIPDHSSASMVPLDSSTVSEGSTHLVNKT